MSPGIHVIGVKSTKVLSLKTGYIDISLYQ
jgi:hypothetical protein